MKGWRVFLVLVGLSVILGNGAQGGIAQGNSDAAHACHKGGWERLQGTDGTRFTDQGACVRHAAQGGSLIPRATPSNTADVAPALDPFGEPGYTISGTGANFTPNTQAYLDVQFHGTGSGWSHAFTTDSQGGGSFDFTPFVAPRRIPGFDLTAYDHVTGHSVTTTVTTVPCA